MFRPRCAIQNRELLIEFRSMVRPNSSLGTGQKELLDSLVPEAPYHGLKLYSVTLRCTTSNSLRRYSRGCFRIGPIDLGLSPVRGSTRKSHTDSLMSDDEMISTSAYSPMVSFC